MKTFSFSLDSMSSTDCKQYCLS